MASVQPRGNKFQLRVTHRLLPKPYFRTFDDEVSAINFGEALEATLAQGHVPYDLAVAESKGADPFLATVLKDYQSNAPITDSDQGLLNVITLETAGVHVSGVNYTWCENYVRSLKVSKNLSPGTIRKRVGTLARVLDWHFRRTETSGKPLANPLRMLPSGYSHYSKTEAANLADGKTAKVDVRRDFRVGPKEEQAVRLALSGVRRQDRERALVVDPQLQLLFDLIIDTGMRLSEAYRLRVDQVDHVKGVIRVEGSKGARGVLKPRVVPMKRELRARLAGWCTGRVGLLFTFWDGTLEGKRKASSKLSVRFGVLFDYAGVGHLTEHDLRHEACCRWVELRDADGRWVFSDTEICRIMGWTSTSMLLRYASLRGEDLADRLA